MNINGNASYLIKGNASCFIKRNASYLIKGYTLIEALVTNSVFALCFALVCSTMIFGANFFGKIKDEIASTSQFVNAFEVMREDLKNHYPDSSPNLGEISKVTNKTAIWQVWDDKDGQKTVQYSIKEGALVRSINGEENILLRGVANFDVKFLDSNLGWLSLEFADERLASHVRLRFSN